MTLLRVVKIGGSLFDLEDLPERLDHWLSSQSSAKNILLAGGGPWADEVRKAANIFHLSEEDSHWLCIRAMSLTAQLLSVLLPKAKLSTKLDEIQLGSANQLWIFDAERFLLQHKEDYEAAPLPHNGDVTSDSIAAKIAIVLGAQQLVLLKSKPSPVADDYSKAAEQGYVDDYFPLIAQNLPAVRFVNLRSF